MTKEELGSLVNRYKLLGLNTHGIRISDRLILGIAKAAFILYRLFVRLFLGSEKRRKLQETGSLNFHRFLYRFVSKFGLKNKVLQIAFPSYGIKSYCRSIDEFNDYRLLTTHESHIIDKLFMPNEGDIVVDAGSYIGLYSLLSAKRVGASGKVIAIEANVSRFQALRANLRLNGLSNVTAVNCILYSKDMPFSFSKYEAILSAGRRGGIVEQEREQRRQEEQIQELSSSNLLDFQNAITLDSILQKTMGSVKPVNWIKIDVEGAELDVLKGASRTLAENQNIAILIEIHRTWL